MNLKKHIVLDLEAISFVAVTAVLTVLLAGVIDPGITQKLQFATKAQQRNTQASMQLPAVPTSTPSPTPVPVVDTASQISPDGTKSVIMKTTHNINGARVYDFIVKDNTDNAEKQIYTTTVDNKDEYSLPFNSWSPDNRYLFILKNNTQAFVFNATGESFSENELFLDITASFDRRNISYPIKAVTGWGAETLIIVNVTTGENTIASYWYEVPSKAVIPLSTVFE